jgi:hypothetical protein
MAAIEGLASNPHIVLAFVVAVLLRTTLLTAITVLTALVALFSDNQKRAARALVVLEKVDRRVSDAIRRRTPPQ